MGSSGDRQLGYTGEPSRDRGVAAGGSWRFDVPGFGRTWARPGNGALPPAEGR